MTFWLRPKNSIKDGTVFSVDRIEDGEAVLININTGEVINVQLDFNVNDGNVVIYKDNQFIKSETKYNKRKEEIINKYERLKRRD